MSKAVEQMINQATNKIKTLDGIKHLQSDREYWKGRLDGLQDALKAIKIESDWCSIDRGST